MIKNAHEFITHHLDHRVKFDVKRKSRAVLRARRGVKIFAALELRFFQKKLVGCH
jgi:hypothetical protein